MLLIKTFFFLLNLPSIYICLLLTILVPPFSDSQSIVDGSYYDVRVFFTKIPDGTFCKSSQLIQKFELIYLQLLTNHYHQRSWTTHKIYDFWSICISLYFINFKNAYVTFNVVVAVTPNRFSLKTKFWMFSPRKTNLRKRFKKTMVSPAYVCRLDNKNIFN